MKKLFMVLAATVICGACLFTSCKKDEENDLKLEEKIIGKWMHTETNGQAMLTNDKKVFNFISSTKCYFSASLSAVTDLEAQWAYLSEADVAINGNKVTVTHHPNENETILEEYTITSINDNEFTADLKITATVDGTVVHTHEETVRYVKVTADYSAAILGTWQGRCTSEGSVFDDGQEHRWQYNADGTYVYYVKDGDNWVSYEGTTLSEYFVDGTLLCTRWIDQGQENREWWEINIDGDKMNWTALRQKEDGSTFTATFEMKKVQ